MANPVEPLPARKSKGLTARLRARKARQDAAYALRIRAKVDKRDGYCRAIGVGPCEGPSEWAHVGEKKRFKTRGQTPTERHTTADSVKLCTRHHRLYDSGQLTIEPTDEMLRCDALCVFTDHVALHRLIELRLLPRDSVRQVPRSDERAAG